MADLVTSGGSGTEWQPNHHIVYTAWLAGAPVRLGETMSSVVLELVRVAKLYKVDTIITNIHKSYNLNNESISSLISSFNSSESTELYAYQRYNRSSEISEFGCHFSVGISEHSTHVSRVNIYMKVNTKNPLSYNHIIYLASWSRSWIERRGVLAGFLGHHHWNQSLQTEMEQRHRVTVPTNLDVVRTGHRGAFWVTFLGRAQCDLLGGYDEVVSRAPALIKDILDDGVWIQLTERPPASRTAVEALENYLSPLFVWMRESANAAFLSTDNRSRSPAATPGSKALSLDPVWSLSTDPARLHDNRSLRMVPYQIRSDEDIEMPVHIYLSSEPDEVQKRIVRDAVMVWAQESPSFDPDPDYDGFHEVTGPMVSGRAMRWIIGFGGIDERRAVHRLSQLLADLQGVEVVRIFAGIEPVG